MTSKRRLAILGAFGGVNIGDEAILESDIQCATAAGYKDNIVVIATANPTTAGTYYFDHPHVRDTIYFKQFRKSLRGVMGRDLFIGGGQVIDGSMGPKLAAVQLLFALLARVTGGSISIGGAGVFQLKTSATRFFYDTLFRLCTSITVRDQASFNALQFSSAFRKKGRLAADVVFSLEPSNIQNTTAQRERIGVAVHNAPHVKFMQFEEAKRLLLEIIRVYGSESVDILVHDSRPAFDLDFARKLSDSISRSAVAPNIRTFSSVNDCLQYYSQTKTVVSPRMHPLIIGAISGCSCVPLTGSSKVAEFARLTGLENYELANTAAIISAIDCSSPPDRAQLRHLARSARACFG